MEREGIDILIVDDEHTLPYARRVLGLSATRPLSELLSITETPDAVFHIVVACESNVDTIASVFNVRRGAYITTSTKKAIGYNVDWVKRLLTAPKAIAIHVSDDDEKDDPYESIGYSRKKE